MYKHFFKRFFDFCIAFCALSVLLLPLAIITIWLHFANKGAGAFFFQERPGKNGKIFKVVKFKSMTDERDADGNLLPDADRITKVGRFVRATSIDELPQLWNVLIGDMALIGPRPLLPKYMDWYTEDEKHRQDVRPGITGWAQCNGRNHCVWEERLAYDVYYVQNLSFGMDVKIIFMTVMNVLKSKDIEVVPNMMDFDTYRQYVLKEAKLTLDEYSKLTQAQKMSIAKPEILTLDDVKLDDVDIKVVRDDVFNQTGGGKEQKISQL